MDAHFVVSYRDNVATKHNFAKYQRHCLRRWSRVTFEQSEQQTSDVEHNNRGGNFKRVYRVQTLLGVRKTRAKHPSPVNKPRRGVDATGDKAAQGIVGHS